MSMPIVAAVDVANRLELYCVNAGLTISLAILIAKDTWLALITSSEANTIWNTGGGGGADEAGEADEDDEDDDDDEDDEELLHKLKNSTQVGLVQ